MDLPPARGGLLDSPTGVTHGVKEGINSTVLQQTGSFGGFDAFGRYIRFIINPHGGKRIDGILALSGTGVADIYAFAFQIFNFCNTGVNRGNQSDRLRMDAEYRAQIFLFAFVESSIFFNGYLLITIT